MTGLWVLLGVLAVGVAFGGYRRLTDGRARAVRDSTPRLDAGQLGAPLGERATLVQFSSAVCTPCRATHRVISQLTGEQPGLAHVDLDAEHHLDLVEQFGVTRTPTVLLLGPDGTVRSRIVGGARRADILEALDGLNPVPAVA